MTAVKKVAVTVALAGLGLLMIPGLVAQAETVDPGIAYEGWFAFTRPQNPTVPVPCLPPPAPNPAGCGPVNPAPVPTPQSPQTGGYVVSTSGGDSGRSSSSGDTGWAAYQWDLFSYIDVTINRFVVTLSHAPDNKGDYGTPVFQACNVVAPWASEPGGNPWADRPLQDCSQPVIPEAKDGKYVLDLTTFAQTWVEGKGYGVVIVPGTPAKSSGLAPFQFTFAGYYSQAANADEVKPRVDFDFTPAVSDFGGDSFGSGGGAIFDTGGSFDTGGFTPDPTIDIIPNDVGRGGCVATSSCSIQRPDAPVALPPLKRAAAETGFPLSALLLLPLAALGFWGVGTALGPAGDPLPSRKGGVSRLIEQRRNNSTHPPRNS